MALFCKRAEELVYESYHNLKHRLVTKRQERKRFVNGLSDTPEVDVDSQRSVVVIAVDCLRADHCSFSDYKRDTTPELDRILDSRTVVSAAPWTYPSVASILTGCYPHTHGAIDSSDYRNEDLDRDLPRIKDDIPLLPELLAVAGYDTYFSTAIATAKIPVQGRAGYNTAVKHNANADSILSDLESWWETDAAQFAYVHLGDLHEPIDLPQEQPFGQIQALDNIRRWDYTGSTEPAEEFEEFRSEKLRLYDSVLAEVQREIKSTIDALAGDPIVVVVGDHGEEFWDNVELGRQYFEDPRGVYGVGHGHSTLPSVSDVPLWTNLSIVNGDGGLVSTVDILPSILGGLGVSELQWTIDGYDWTENSHHTVYCEETAYGHNQISVVSDQFQLVLLSNDDEIFVDRKSGNEAGEEDEVARLRALVPDSKSFGAKQAVSDSTESRLEDLGYL